MKQKYQISDLFVFDPFDKIFTTGVARLLKIKTIAGFCPETSPATNWEMKSWLAKILIRKNNCVCFSDKSQKLLEQQKFRRLYKIDMGIKLGLGHQDNIFNNLARDKGKHLDKKFFSLGTVLGLQKKHNLEAVFAGLKISQTVIPNLQFIIIGDGPQRKNLQWLARRMGIESLVWFVGEQKCLKKWLEGLDVYLYAAKANCLADINYLLLAMQAGLPTISPADLEASEIIHNFQDGVILKENTAENWSHSLIRLKQNKKLRQDLGRHAKQLVEKNYTVEQMVAEFKKIT